MLLEHRKAQYETQEEDHELSEVHPPLYFPASLVMVCLCPCVGQGFYKDSGLLPDFQQVQQQRDHLCSERVSTLYHMPLPLLPLFSGTL